jgi:kynurenine formamidase
VVVDFTSRADGEAIDARAMGAALDAARHTLTPGHIVLVRTGRAEFYDGPDYIGRGPGVSAEATSWLYERAVRVMGIDAWGWERPPHAQAADALPGRSS